MGDGVQEVNEINKNEFEEFNRINSFKIHFISRLEQEKWIKEIIDNCIFNSDKRILFNILIKKNNEISYGSILNKSFLIASAINAKSIHRRDSDTKLNLDSIFPLEYEMKYLCKKYSDFPEFSVENDNMIYLVGGNYTGEWTVDLNDLYQKDPNLLYRMQALKFPDKTYDEVISIANKRYVNPNVALKMQRNRLSSRV